MGTQLIIYHRAMGPALRSMVYLSPTMFSQKAARQLQCYGEKAGARRASVAPANERQIIAEPQPG